MGNERGTQKKKGTTQNVATQAQGGPLDTELQEEGSSSPKPREEKTPVETWHGKEKGEVNRPHNWREPQKKKPTWVSFIERKNNPTLADRPKDLQGKKKKRGRKSKKNGGEGHGNLGPIDHVVYRIKDPRVAQNQKRRKRVKKRSGK